MADIDPLISRLRDYRTRSAAKSELLEMGEKAVDPLIAALDSPHAGVRWSVAVTLGELKAEKALPHLVEALKDDEIMSAAEESLTNITGENLGPDYDAWKRWIEMGESDAAAEGPAETAMTDSDLVAKAVYNTAVSADEQSDGGWSLRVPIGNRHQDVALNLKVQDQDGVPLVKISTQSGPANRKLYEWALRQNFKISAGAIALDGGPERPEFVVVEVLPRAVVTPQVLIKVVGKIARKGDQLRNVLEKASRK